MSYNHPQFYQRDPPTEFQRHWRDEPVEPFETELVCQLKPGVKLGARHRREIDTFALPHARKMVVETDQSQRFMKGSYMELDWVETDHCYARPWNWRPESSILRPTKTLFMLKQDNKKKKRSINPLAPEEDGDDVIDVEKEVEVPASIYDVTKSKYLMEECERHAAIARNDDDDVDDWEGTISRVNWTPTQHRIFNGIVSILNNDHMARLAYSGVHNEAILRRTVIDKSVERLRRLIATIAWDTKLIQWLHLLLIDHLNRSYLVSYLDMLQTLKGKLPTFFEKMLYSPATTNRLGALGNESLFPLLKRVWDPVASNLLQDKPKKLPTNPVLVIVSSGSSVSKRYHKWINLLANLATVVTVPFSLGNSGFRMTTTNGLDQMYASTRAKIQEIRTDYPNRNIVLLGFNAGAALALQIAQVEQVLCVVALGFSLLTAEGRRGDPEDNLLELQCPVLFVVGQCSNTTMQEDMEDLRERMRVETGLIVVGSADDCLRISKKKKRSEGITQSVVDRCIVDEVGEFISGVILSPYPPQIRQSPSHVSQDSKKAKAERKRFSSNTSSLESEPPSPTPPKISRPVGRPPGSKSKKSTESKFGQGTPSVSPSVPRVSSPQPSQITPSTPTTPDRPPPPPYDTSPPPLVSTTEKSKSAPEYASTNLPVKRIKTLKPTVVAHPPDKTSSKMTGASLGKSTSAAPVKHGFPFGPKICFPPPASPFIQQGGLKTIPPVQPKSSGASSIRVLENVTLSSGSKLVSTLGRTIDLSKITLVNSLQSKSTGHGNVMLLPDGKIKTVHKGNTKYITSKKQLMGHKAPPKPVKKVSYVPHQPIQTTLPPPTNLTTQDIMSLPIIFADDNQLLEPTDIQPPPMTPLLPPEPIITSLPPPAPAPATSQPSKIITSAGNKFVVLNKQVTTQSSGSYIITPASIRKIQPMSSAKNSKFTKIILSKREENLKLPGVMAHISNLSPEISIRKILPEKKKALNPSEPIDLETEIVATAVPKPHTITSEIRNFSLFKKMTDSVRPDLLKIEVPGHVGKQIVGTKQAVPVPVKQAVPVPVKQAVSIPVKQEVVKQEVTAKQMVLTSVPSKQEVPVPAPVPALVTVKQEVSAPMKQDVPSLGPVKQDKSVEVKQDKPAQVKQDKPAEVKQDKPVQVKQESEPVQEGSLKRVAPEIELPEAKHVKLSAEGHLIFRKEDLLDF